MHDAMRSRTQYTYACTAKPVGLIKHPVMFEILLYAGYFNILTAHHIFTDYFVSVRVFFPIFFFVVLRVMTRIILKFTDQQPSFQAH